MRETVDPQQKLIEALEASEKQFRSIFDLAAVGIAKMDPHGNYLLINQQLCRMLGYTEEELLSKTFREITHPEDVSINEDFYQKALAGEIDAYTVEKRYLHKDGSVVWGHLSVSLLRDPLGSPLYFIAILQDISERKQIEEALEKSETLFRTLAEVSPVGIFRTDTQGECTYVNARWCEIAGLLPEEALGRGWSRAIHPEDRRRIGEEWAQSTRSAQPFMAEYRFQSREGKTTWVVGLARVQRKASGDISGYVGTITDITARKQAEDTIRANEDRLRVALRTIDAAVFHQDAELRYTWMYQPQLGYTTDQVIGKTDADLLPPEAASQATAIKRRVLESGEPARGEVVVRLNESTAYYDLLVEPLVSAEGRIVGITGASLDITARWHIDQSLRQRERELQEAQRIAKIGSWTFDIAADTLIWSDETYRIFEIEKSQFGATYNAFLNLVHPDDREAVNAEYNRSVAAHQPYEIAHRLRMADGRIKHVRERAETRYDASGRPIQSIGTVQDVTEYRQLQDQLFESQKLESLGRLAGGVAHDFNNLLTAITGYTELAAEETAPGSDAAQFLANVQAAAQRAVTLTNQLLMYARRQIVEFRTVNLNKVILGMDPLLRRALGESYELILALDEQLWNVKSNVSQLEQVLMNLIVNARDAMSDDGRILVETTNIVLEAGLTASPPDLVPGEYVMLAVSDNGCGIPEEVQQRLFEPFFTTKEVGKGTGLGLATCYGIIKQSSGAIQVHSEPGQGTCFRIFLPRLQETLEQNEPAPEEPLPSGTETILLLDDEPMVRDIAARILRSQGYHVLEANSGAEAMHIQSEWEGTIDLLVTDVVMPLMGGKELAYRLRQVRPGIKVLYVSGYTQNVIEQQGVIQPEAGLITKPFTSAELIKKVREALNTGNGGQRSMPQ